MAINRRSRGALLFLTLAMVFSLAVPVLGAEATYQMTTQYMESIYYENFSKIPLSGDQATDVIAIALSQLGYHEGDSNADLGGTNTKGSKDFVEYNVLYGKLDNNQGNGMSYGYYWCASFVNWCLRQAGVSKEASAAAEVSCQRWMTKCEEAEMLHSRGAHTPVAGDLIFFKDQGSLVKSTHIGLVLYSDSVRVYTIEGNTTPSGDFSSNGDYVALKSYPLTSSYIVGYCSPKYEKNADVIPVDYSGVHLSEGLYISEREIGCYSNEALSGKASKIPAHAVFSVTQVTDRYARVSYASDGKRIEGYAMIDGNARQITAESGSCVVSYLDEDGTAIFPRQFRTDESEITLPEGTPGRSDAGFLGWSLKKGDRSRLYQPGDTVSVADGDVTFFAEWDHNFYLITFKDADGSLLHQKYGYYGGCFEIPEPDSVPKGYAFAGWSVDGEIVEIDGCITGDATYTALYREISESDGGNNGSETESDTGNGGASGDPSDRVEGYGCYAFVGTMGTAIPILLTSVGAFLFAFERKKR